MIPITKPFLPPIGEYETLLKGVWARNWFTNNGPLVNELELSLKQYLGLDHLLYTTNGTTALQMAIKVLRLRGEVITTPFSYVATTASIAWEGCTPVFADIHPRALTIDPASIEALITDQTSAIIATHVYGNPCPVDAIQEIAQKHGLRVIYDAAHCFGTRYKGKTIYCCGDISIASFHATKLYHTVEGGALMTAEPELLKALSFLRNFGHDGPEEVVTLGINAKNSELHAAMGLVNLQHIEEILADRKRCWLHYKAKLQHEAKIQFLQLADEEGYNYAYFPIMFPTEELALKAKTTLEQNEIFPRRFFYPSLSGLPYVKKTSTPVADDAARRVLCLPMYHGLSPEEQDYVCRIVLRTLRYN